MKKMKVLIVGSLPRDKESEEEKKQYCDACRDIGRKLADCGWPIGIGTFKPDTADALVIDGAAESGRKIKVTVYLRWEEFELFAEEIGRRKSQAENINFKYEPIKGTWNTGRIEQIQKSDIVFLIGGGDKTAPAFIVAHLLKKPCLPIPGFGGASEEQWAEFSARIEHLRLNPERQLGQWTKPWRSKDSVSAVLRDKPWRSEDSASAVLKFARRYVDSQPYLEKDRFLAPSLLIAAGAALIWTILFFGQSPARGWVIFGILATTSVMGTALYWLASPSRRRNDTRGNAMRFFTRVVAAVIEAITLFLLLLAGTGFINGNISMFFDSLSDRGAFARFALIAGIFGLASGVMTEAIYQSLQSRLIKQISTSDKDADH